MSDQGDIAACAAKLEDVAAHLEGLDSGSGDAVTFRMTANFLRQQAQDIEALRADVGRYYDALWDIQTMPEQGGCDDGPDAVGLWMLMRMRARRALNGEP